MALEKWPPTLFCPSPGAGDEIRSRQIETEKSLQLFRNKNGRGVAECSQDRTNPAAA
jgi:hypothetical protein